MNNNLRVEVSKDNHFLYFKVNGRQPKDYVAPQVIQRMTFDQWLEKAVRADVEKMEATEEHVYMTMGTGSNRESNIMISSNFITIAKFVFIKYCHLCTLEAFFMKDLAIFSTKTNNFWVTNVNKNKGIQCRLGMRGVIAESHYDAGKNMVAMLKGAKRYILNPPEACPYLHIISSTKHPSYRHSTVDWSNLSVAREQQFEKAKAIETILKQGEVLYIPSFWFHYIVSLQYSIQCNTRSGSPKNMVGEDKIQKCYAMHPYDS